MKFPNPPLRYRKLAFLTLLTLFSGLTTVFADGPGVQGRVFEVKEDGSVSGVVPGANIEFINGSATTTDAAGFFKVKLGPGSYIYKVTAPGFKDEDSGRGMQLQLSDGFAVYNFALTRGANDPDNPPPLRPEFPTGRLEGRVFEKIKGNPGIGGAVITLRRDGTRNLTRVISSIGENAGEYAIGLPVGTWRASVSATGFEQSVDVQPIEILLGQTTNRDFGLKRPDLVPGTEQGIRGVVRVIPGDRKPVKLEDVSLRLIPISNRAVLTQDLKSPKRDGQFEVRLRAGTYRLEAAAKGYETAESGPVHVFPDRFSNVKLVLRGDLGLKVEFFAYDAKTKHPLAGTAIRLQPKSGSSSAIEGQSDRLGLLGLRLPEAGSWNMMATREGYANWSQTSEINASPDSRIMIAMKSGASSPPPEITQTTELSVTVLDVRKKQPVFGAGVTVRKGSQRLSDALRGDTDNKGQVKFKLTGKGDYTALVRATGFKAGGSRVSVNSGENKILEVLLEPDLLTETTPPATMPEPKQSLNIQVVGNGQPVAGAVVSIMDRNLVVGRGLSDSTGFYRSEMPAGSFTLKAEARGFNAGSSAIKMKLGRNANVLIALTPTVVTMPPPAVQDSTLNVEVKRHGGGVVAGATVSVIQGNRTIGRGLTDQLGRYQRTMSEPGVYVVKAEALGYNPGSGVVRYGSGSSNVEINLTPMTSSIPPLTTVPQPPVTMVPGFTQPQNLTLNVQVIQRGGGPVHGAVVSVAQGRNVIARGVTDQRGVWSTSTGPGIFSLKAEARGYLPGGSVATVTSRSVNAQIQLNGATSLVPSNPVTINPPTRVPTIPGFNNPQIIPGGRITIPGMTTNPNSEITPKTPSTRTNPAQAVYVVEGLPPGQKQWQVLGRFSNAQQAQLALHSYQTTYGARKWQLRVNTQQGQ